MSAWLRSPGAVPGAISSASCHSRFDDGDGCASQRAKTRFTFPSTIGAGRPNATLAIAPAV
jgi:hypothetical protein